MGREIIEDGKRGSEKTQPEEEKEERLVLLSQGSQRRERKRRWKGRQQRQAHFL